MKINSINRVKYSLTASYLLISASSFGAESNDSTTFENAQAIMREGATKEKVNSKKAKVVQDSQSKNNLSNKTEESIDKKKKRDPQVSNLPPPTYSSDSTTDDNNSQGKTPYISSTTWHVLGATIVCLGSGFAVYSAPNTTSSTPSKTASQA